MLLGLGAVGGVVIMQFSSLAAELPGYQDNLKRLPCKFDFHGSWCSLGA
jgi:hypothetical protein